MKILTIVGARPQFIKAAMTSRAIINFNRNNNNNNIEEFILHTGQHYDENMSSVFFSEMNIPRPTYQLNCGGFSHGEMTGKMLIEIEKIMINCNPDYVLVYGDTNSTLSGALCAVKLNIPVIHIEAGLRSYNKKMPEEINRILTDHVSTFLFCPTSQSIKNLSVEGIKQGVYHVGDVMYDAAITFGSLAEKSSKILTELNLQPKSYHLSTVHRAENIGNKEKLSSIMAALSEISTKEYPVVLPLHPSTNLYINQYKLKKTLDESSIQVIAPVSFLDMVMLEKNAKTILTDSGGIQKEAYFHKVPCITLREETEWVETVSSGWNQVAGYKKKDILKCLYNQTEKLEILEYGNGNTAENIINLLWNEKKF